MVVFTPVRLILVRHGRTEFNAQGRVQGGGHLDSLGQAQVQALAKRLLDEPLAAIYSSPFSRTQETARAIAQFHGLPIRKRAALRDIDYGIYSGMLFSEASALNPDLWEMWANTPQAVYFPGGERLDDLRKRLLQFLNYVSRNHAGQTVLAVSHDSPISQCSLCRSRPG